MAVLLAAGTGGPWPVTWLGGTLDLGGISGGNSDPQWSVCSVDNDSQTTAQNVDTSPPATSFTTGALASLTFSQTRGQL
jgi:hypothetical protein